MLTIYTTDKKIISRCGAMRSVQHILVDGLAFSPEPESARRPPHTAFRANTMWIVGTERHRFVTTSATVNGLLQKELCRRFDEKYFKKEDIRCTLRKVVGK